MSTPPNPPPANPSAGEVMRQMAQSMASLISQVTALTATVNTLATTVTTLAGVNSAHPGQTRPVSIVEKPKAFEGKTSEAARLFRSSFAVWVQSQEAVFAQ